MSLIDRLKEDSASDEYQSEKKKKKKKPESDCAGSPVRCWKFSDVTIEANIGGRASVPVSLSFLVFSPPADELTHSCSPLVSVLLISACITRTDVCHESPSCFSLNHYVYIFFPPIFIQLFFLPDRNGNVCISIIERS